MIRSIITLAHPQAEILHQVSKPVKLFNRELGNFVDEMFDAMYAARGIGLAAVQVGELKRIVVMDIPDVSEEPLTLINPVIIKRSRDYIDWEEGCLSVPGCVWTVQRNRSILLEYQDVKGAKHEIKAEDLFSVCIQHELDHLEGRIFLENAEENEHKKINKLLAEKNLPNLFV